MEKIKATITAPKGFRAAGIAAGIKKNGNKDVCLIASEVPASAAAVFTTNKFAAAPVQLDRENIKKGRISVIAVNAGCANACTGERGMKDARDMARIAAKAAGVAEGEVLVSSTGVIGAFLNMAKLKKGIAGAWKAISKEGGANAAAAIMTTDTRAKTTAFTAMLGGKKVTMAGMAKGSGMICPNMATMLAYMTTDAAIKPAVLQKALSEATDRSFNLVIVDGDTSTNDTFCVLANGLAKNPVIDSVRHPDYPEFLNMLTEASIDLARQMARDGEGATKFIEINVKNARTEADAKAIARSIAKSPLVKTAFFGQDGNWGRIVAAAGYAGADLDPEKLSVFLDDVAIFRKGMDAGSPEARIDAVMKKKEITVTLDLDMGTREARVWTCDFSYDYVKINGSYRS